MHADAATTLKSPRIKTHPVDRISGLSLRLLSARHRDVYGSSPLAAVDDDTVDASDFCSWTRFLDERLPPAVCYWDQNYPLILVSPDLSVAQPAYLRDGLLHRTNRHPFIRITTAAPSQSQSLRGPVEVVVARGVRNRLSRTVDVRNRFSSSDDDSHTYADFIEQIVDAHTPAVAAKKPAALRTRPAASAATPRRRSVAMPRQQQSVSAGISTAPPPLLSGLDGDDYGRFSELARSNPPTQHSHQPGYLFADAASDSDDPFEYGSGFLSESDEDDSVAADRQQTTDIHIQLPVCKTSPSAKSKTSPSAKSKTSPSSKSNSSPSSKSNSSPSSKPNGQLKSSQSSKLKSSSSAQSKSQTKSIAGQSTKAKQQSVAKSKTSQSANGRSGSAKVQSRPAKRAASNGKSKSRSSIVILLSDSDGNNDDDNDHNSTSSCDDDDDDKASDASAEQPEREYEVEAIVGHRFGRGGHIQFQVKWSGWPSSANTWEPLRNLEGCVFLSSYLETHVTPKR